MRAQGPSERLCELLRWVTLGSFETGNFELATRCASESHAVAQALGDVRQIALALNALGAGFERMGDPWQAERVMNEAAALVRDSDHVFEQLVSLNNLCGVALGAFYLLRDSGNDAESAAALQRALHYARGAQPHARTLGDPFFLMMTEGNLAEALLHAGELDEAEALLRQSLQQAHEHGYLAQNWRMRCSLAELQLLREQTQEACDGLHELIDEMGDKAPAATALRAHHALYRASKALGRFEPALTQLEACDAIARKRSTAQLMAQSRHFVTRLEAEQARREASAHQAHALELQERVLHDPLTGLGNRRFVDERVEPMAQQCSRSARPLTLALIDVDRFKSINDRFGHEIGDRVLRQLAQMLKENTRGSDLLVRYGGEEFLVVFPDTHPELVFEVCERLRERVQAYPWQAFAADLSVTLSIGLASAAPYALDQLIAQADRAMYRAKHLGRNQVALAC
jgi:diguanylate cyclase (GGDEF)-like protein